MADLTGSTIATTYQAILALPLTGGNTTNLVALTDGDGVNTFALSIATTSIAISATDRLYFDDGSDTYIYEAAADKLNFVVGGDANGFVLKETGGVTSIGIGTDAPGERLHIISSTTEKPVIKIQNARDDAQEGAIEFWKTRYDTHEITGTLQVGEDNDELGSIKFYGGKNTSGTAGTQFYGSMRMTVRDVTHTSLDSAIDFFTYRDNAAKYIYMYGGYLGINTSTPAYAIEVKATASNESRVIAINNSGTTNATAGSYLYLIQDDNTIMQDNERMGGIAWYGCEAVDGTIQNGATITAYVDAVWENSGTYEHASRLEFAVQNAANTDNQLAKPGMTLYSNNYVAIGYDTSLYTPDSPLHILAATATSTQAALHVQCNESDVDNGDTLLWLHWSGDANIHDAAVPKIISIHDSGGEIGYFTTASDGNINTAWTNVSDIRLKKDIKDTSLEGLNIINGVKVRDFKWNDERKNVNVEGMQVIGGFIADELYEVYPYATSGTPGAMKTKVTPAVKAVEAKDAVLDDDGNVLVEAVEAVEAVSEKTEEVMDVMGVTQGNLISVMLKSIQELSAKVTALENA